MTATTLADAWAAEARELPTADASGVDLDGLLRAVWYRGALAAATSGLTREQLMAELLGYARAIGTAAERARG